MPTSPQYEPERRGLGQARRVVIKVGSRVLVQRNGRPDPARFQALTRQLAQLIHGGREVVLVTSGAVGAGMEALKRTVRPATLPDLQMAAAVGQTRLMNRYADLMAQHRIVVGQILLTHDDLKHRQRHLNARNTILHLLKEGLLPIVNENDAVAVDEIKVGDNDELASLTAILVDADALVLLSTVNGLRAPTGGGRTRRVPFLAQVDEQALALVQGPVGPLSTGGMATKLEAAARVAHVGIPAVVADGRKPDTLPRLFNEEPVGTLVGRPRQAGQRSLSGRKRWIAYFHRPQGTLEIDDGAAEALCRRGKSLLPIGIRNVIGDFELGAVVSIRTTGNKLVARGFTAFSSEQVEAIKGKKTSAIAGILGRCDYEAVVHRDNMVILADTR